MAESVEYAVGIFYKAGEDKIATTAIPSVTDLPASKLCSALPMLLKGHGLDVGLDVKFRAFWLGSDTWITTEHYELTPVRAGGVLLVVDEALGTEAPGYYSKLAKIVPGFRDLRGLSGPTKGVPPSPPLEDAGSQRVFLVHGHDEAALHAVARFLEQIGLVVIVLREQPNNGRTIIEKFEAYSDVGFAVVLLTPDDRGGASGAKPEHQQSRPRQNVILELGYFLGRLGRRRVCALYTEGVEIPSDYSGVLYIKLETGGAWKLDLAKEMKVAGLTMDLNRAVGA